MGGQLGLFGGGDGDAIEPEIDDEERALAARVPRFVRFGTSSWSFPGWPQMWRGPGVTEDALARRGLGAYAAHPLFRAVGLDRSYYGPLRDEDLAAYARALAGAPDFRMVSKVWDEITTFVFPSHPRYGARAGTKNPSFLDADRFASEVLEPYERAFSAHAGPFVFELTPMPKHATTARDLAARIDAFLGRLAERGRAAHAHAHAHRYAFELRNAELLGDALRGVLADHRAAYVFTYWTAMPPIRRQLVKGAIGAPFTIARLMLPPFTRYEVKKAAFAPFDRRLEPQPEMQDDVVALLEAAADAGCEDAFVIANNKAEGSAPLTIRALARRLAAR